MEIKKVTDAAFRKYGKVVKNVDFTALVEELEKTPCTAEVVYEPSVPELEALPVYKELQDVTYGEMPIQIGFCNGNNYKLNALEYHRTSEIDVAASDLILLLGWQADVEEDYTYDTSKVEAFLLPKGVAVELYATTLHYAPCNTEESGFRMVVVLPKGTNLELTKKHENATDEEKLLFGTNKWVIAHPDAKIEGAFNGIIGENLKLD